MSKFIEGDDRSQATLFPERLDDYVAEDNPVRVIDVFIDDLDISGLGFKAEPAATGRPGYDPRTLLKVYVYGYLNREQSSRRLEQAAQRNIEAMWLTGRLAPDFKTIADFRKDNPEAIRLVCREFVMLCKKLNLLSEKLVAIDGSKFKAVNSRDRNFTKAKMKRRLRDVESTIERYLARLDETDRTEPRPDDPGTLQDKVAKPDTSPNKAKGYFNRSRFRYVREDDEYECPAGERLTFRMSSNERGKEIRRYWSSACGRCAIKSQCTNGKERRVRRRVHEDVLERAAKRLRRRPEVMLARRSLVEHPFGTLKSWTNSNHFLTKRLSGVSTETSLQILAYNMKRAINLVGTRKIIEKIAA